ncbi:unnamed protein product [Lathyrus sativus]|nr:unnamed protein product [Lathyrus sativus]
MMGSPTATWVSCAFLFETRVSGEKAEKVVKTVIASVGTCGIFVLWKSKDILVDVLQDDSQFIHMKVVQEKKSECLLIALYAKPMESLKAWLWKQVLQMWAV